MIDLFGYDLLIEDFLNRKISVAQFERFYIDKFLEGDEPMIEDLFLELDWLFAEVDAYTDMPISEFPNPENYINEDQLRESAAKTLKEIRSMRAG